MSYLNSSTISRNANAIFSQFGAKRDSLMRVLSSSHASTISHLLTPISMAKIAFAAVSFCFWALVIHGQSRNLAKNEFVQISGKLLGIKTNGNPTARIEGRGVFNGRNRPVVLADSLRIVAVDQCPLSFSQRNIGDRRSNGNENGTYTAFRHGFLQTGFVREALNSQPRPCFDYKGC